MSFNDAGDGTFAGRSRVEWSEEDIDADGHPGLTVDVDPPVCSGQLYVGSLSTTKAYASFREGEFRGNAAARTQQEVLGAKGACLRLFAPNTDETTKGPFAYAPVPEGTSCSDLLARGWPVDAER